MNQQRRIGIPIPEREIVFVDNVFSGGATFTHSYNQELENGSWQLVEWRTRQPYRRIARRSSKRRGSNPKARRRWSSFQHYKSSMDMRAIVPSRFTTVYSIYDGDLTNAYKNTLDVYSKEFAELVGGYNDPTIGLEPLIDDGNGGPVLDPVNQGEIVPPDDLDDLILESLKRLNPKLNKKLSLVNSVIELKDFLTLKQSVQRVGKAIKSLVKGDFSRKTLMQVLRAAADGYLQAKFNILPLVSDIKGIIASMSGLQSRLARDLKNAGTPQVSYYGKPLGSTEVKIQGPVVVDGGSSIGVLTPNFGVRNRIHGNWLLSRTVYEHPSWFHAQMRYIAKYNRLQREHALLLSRLDLLGVNLNPAIIWNAIPWSFVVDWFLNIQDFLDRFAIGFMDPQLQVLEYSWSVSYKRRVVLDLEISDPPFTPLPLQLGTRSIRFPQVTQTAYRRDVGPPKPSLIESSGLSSQEFSLASALVVSRERKKRKSRRPKRWYHHLSRHRGGVIPHIGKI